MSVTNDDSGFNVDNSDVNEVVEYVRREFKNFLAKREELVIKLGKAIENCTGQKEKDNICTKLRVHCAKK